VKWKERDKEKSDDEILINSPMS